MFASFSAGETNGSVWYSDSAAASHMTPSKGILFVKSSYAGPIKICVENGTLLPIKHIGNLVIHTSGRPLSLKSVCHVPLLKHNLLSINQLCRDNHCPVIFHSSSFFVKDN